MTSCKQVIVEDIPVKDSADDARPRSISIKTLQVYEVEDGKKNPILVKKSIQIEKDNNEEKKGNKQDDIVLEYNQIDGGEGEGKNSIQKYIEEK